MKSWDFSDILRRLGRGVRWVFSTEPLGTAGSQPSTRAPKVSFIEALLGSEELGHVAPPPSVRERKASFIRSVFASEYLDYVDPPSPTRKGRRSPIKMLFAREALDEAEPDRASPQSRLAWLVSSEPLGEVKNDAREAPRQPLKTSEAKE